MGQDFKFPISDFGLANCPPAVFHYRIPCWIFHSRFMGRDKSNSLFFYDIPGSMGKWLIYL